MKCKLVGQNLKAFSKAVRLFAKLSEEVFIIADNKKMKMQSLNQNKTAFVEMQFGKRFFGSYECIEETKCKLFMKSLILVFRVTNIDKIVSSCTLIMNDQMPRIVFEMKCRNGVNREYFLPYMESNQLRYDSDMNQTNLCFRAESKVMFECLQNFSNETKDITVWLTSQQILFKSYFDDIEEQDIMTSFSYKSREFQNYNITNEISVTFNLKDLKHFIEFATFHDQKIDCYFEASGKPIHFVVNTNEHYLAKLMLATHDFPEDNVPIPPSFPNSNAQNSSSGDISFNFSAQPQNESSIRESLNVAIHPQCILNTSATNSVSNNISNQFPTNYLNQIDSMDVDSFPDDDNVIEDILSQMPNYSVDNVDGMDGPAVHPSSEAIARLSGEALKRYHMSVLFGEDDNPVTSSQDILVPESDEEQ